MQLTKLKFKNVLSFDEFEQDFDGLTFVVDENLINFFKNEGKCGSGKSNIFRGFKYLVNIVANHSEFSAENDFEPAPIAKRAPDDFITLIDNMKTNAIKEAEAKKVEKIFLKNTETKEAYIEATFELNEEIQFIFELEFSFLTLSLTQHESAENGIEIKKTVEKDGKVSGEELEEDLQRLLVLCYWWGDTDIKNPITGMFGAPLNEPLISNSNVLSLTRHESYKTPKPVAALELKWRRKFDFFGAGEIQVSQVNNVLPPEFWNTKMGIIFFDEPDSHLDQTLVIKLQNILEKIAETCTVVVMTHCKDLIPLDKYQNILKVSKSPEGNSKCHELDLGTKGLRWINEPNKLPIFFADSVLFVEGASDKKFMRALIKLKKVSAELTVISMGSCTGFPTAILAAENLGVNYKILLDFDVLTEEKAEDGKKLLGNVSGLKFNNNIFFYKITDTFPEDLSIIKDLGLYVSNKSQKKKIWIFSNQANFDKLIELHPELKEAYEIINIQAPKNVPIEFIFETKYEKDCFTLQYAERKFDFYQRERNKRLENLKNDSKEKKSKLHQIQNFATKWANVAQALKKHEAQIFSDLDGTNLRDQILADNSNIFIWPPEIWDIEGLFEMKKDGKLQKKTLDAVVDMINDSKNDQYIEEFLKFVNKPKNDVADMINDSKHIEENEKELHTLEPEKVNQET